jgi:hypothetical protein
LESRYFSMLPSSSRIFGVLLCLPVATIIGVSQAEAAKAQAVNPVEAPYTEQELQPFEEEIEESLPPKLPEESRDNFNLWSEDEYDVFGSDDFAEIEDYETDIYEEQPGPADGRYEIYDADEDDGEGVVNNDPFSTNESEDDLNIYEDNDLYDDDADDMYDTYEGLGDDNYDIIDDGV